MAVWDTDLRLGRHALTLNQFGIALPVTGDKVPFIDITVVDIPNLAQEWHMEPNVYQLSDHGPWPLSINDRWAAT